MFRYKDDGTAVVQMCFTELQCGACKGAAMDREGLLGKL